MTTCQRYLPVHGCDEDGNPVNGIVFLDMETLNPLGSRLLDAFGNTYLGPVYGNCHCAVCNDTNYGGDN